MLERVCRASRGTEDPEAGRVLLLQGLYGGGEPQPRVMTREARLVQVEKAMGRLRQVLADALASEAFPEGGRGHLLRHLHPLLSQSAHLARLLGTSALLQVLALAVPLLARPGCPGAPNLRQGFALAGRPRLLSGPGPRAVVSADAYLPSGARRRAKSAGATYCRTSLPLRSSTTSSPFSG